MQTLFSAWKDRSHQWKDRKANLLGRILKGWRDVIKNRNDLKKKAFAVLRIDESRTEDLLLRVFNALRVNKQTEMFMTTSEELNEEKPLRQQRE
jgi:hypothetical protein